jgi:hypothetical protein
MDIVHDAWVDLDDPLFGLHGSSLDLPLRLEDPSQRRVIQRLGILKKVLIPTLRGWLRIEHVEWFRLEDEAQTGQACIESILYDPSHRVVTITSSIPVTFTARVSSFEIKVEHTHQVVDSKIRWSLWGPYSA